MAAGKRRMGRRKRSRDGPADVESAAPMEIHKPTADQFKQEAVARAVLKETLTHPATIYPVAGSGIGIAMTCILGATPLSLGLIVSGMLVGGVSWVINFVARGQIHSARYVARLREQLREAEQQEVANLAWQCDQLGFNEGARQARELSETYQKLRNFLRSTMDRQGGQSLEDFRCLAEDVAREGTSVLRQAADLYQALKQIDCKELSLDLKTYQRQRSKLEAGTEEADRLELKIKELTNRLEKIAGKEAHIDELISQAKEQEAALQSAHMDLLELGSADPDAALMANGGASQRLIAAIEARRNVERRLRGEASPAEQAREQEYLRAAEAEGSTAVGSDVEAARRAERRLHEQNHEGQVSANNNLQAADGNLPD